MVVGGEGRGGLEGQQRSSTCLESAGRGGAGFVARWQAVTTATCVREALALGEELVLRFEDGRELAVMEVESETCTFEKTRCQEGRRKSKAGRQQDDKHTWRRRPKGLPARSERAALRRRRRARPPCSRAAVTTCQYQ